MMKLAVLAALTGSAAAFAPSSNGAFPYFDVYIILSHSG